MSRLMLSPNYVSCTVNQARNLPDKGKNGGPDAFCTIGMGKEKFVTAVREKNTAPDWHEQCDMPVVDDATIKLTVYHSNKSSLSKGDFIGRAYVQLRNLQDYDRVHTNWYPLTNREGRVDKDRGEINVTLQFYSKNNTTGSVMDLATKKKHLSLKDIKHSLGDKLKAASKHRKSEKYSGENQLADQRRRLGGGEDGNGRDFLEDSISDTTSFSGSHMSLNSMSFNNNTNEQPRKPDNKPSNMYNHTPVTPKKNATLPDIVVEQTGKNPAPLPPSKNSAPNGLSVLGYPNVKSVPVNPKVRQELDYLDREELLHVIAYQNDLIKKRDSRVKDLEQYTDGLLVKIVEQCPSILQSGNMKVNYK